MAGARTRDSSPAETTNGGSPGSPPGTPRKKVPAGRIFGTSRRPKTHLMRAAARVARTARRVGRMRGIRWLVAIISPGKHTAWFRKGLVPPRPSFNLDEGRRVDVLIALHNGVRDSIHRWEDRLYQGSLASAGAMLLTVGFFLQHPVGVAVQEAAAWAMFLFGFLTTFYLVLAARARAENGAFLVKIEAGLGLCEYEAYLVKTEVVGYSGRWMRDWRVIPLLLGHAVIWGFSVYVVSAYPDVKLPL